MKTAESEAERLREYRLANPDVIKATGARHRAKRLQSNPDGFRAANAAKSARYRMAHPDRAREALARWRAKNPGKSNDHNHRARAQQVGHVSYKQVVQRDGDICYLCGDFVIDGLAPRHPLSRSFDHVVPLIAGGAHANDNLKVAHYGCNLKKGRH